MSKSHLFCMAPMMDCTDRHDRYLMRLLSRHMRLYTEMVVSAALIHGDRDRFLAHHVNESPVALQLGGSDPTQMAEAAALGEAAGYDEINMNVGCPSDRVKSGQFGACLMLKPQLTGDCVAAMIARVRVPVTVKCRLGVDNNDSYDELSHFVDTMRLAGCRVIIVHARKAWLSGLSPKQNREIPALDYERVYRLKRDFNDIQIILNGGLQTVEQCREIVKAGGVDGVMVGRSAYSDPWAFATLDQQLFDDDSPIKSRGQVLDEYIEYMRENLDAGVYLKHMSRHLLGLYHGMPGARHWRRYLSENATDPAATIDVIHRARQLVEGDQISQRQVTPHRRTDSRSVSVSDRLG